MKTINQIISQVDEIIPNTISAEIKAGWIIEVDSLVNSEIVKGLSYAVPEFPADGDNDLLVPPPYDKVYGLYVEAQIARYMENYEGYNNNTALYNAAFDSYAAYYRRNNVPKEPKWPNTAITVSTANNTFSIANNPLKDGDRVIFRTTQYGGLPEGLFNGYEYFVMNKSGSAFQVSGTEYGTAIDITSTGGTYTMEKASARIRNLW
jgi:hypothetical protein